MSATPDASGPQEIKPLTFRRFLDGKGQAENWQEEIFDADHSYKCPTYIQSAPPCQASCPAGEDIRGALNIVRGVTKCAPGETWQEAAWRRLTAANPLPAVMGRVCPAPCEAGCNRKAVEEAVGINAVEHFLGDWAIAQGLGFPPAAQSSGASVAVVGGGPAGLSAAYQLALKGHAVTIFEARDQLGGMMRYGIPGFRTPRALLEAEIDRILKLGVAARLNCRVGADVTLESLEREYDAVFIGIGAQKGRALPCEGGEAPNCVSAIEFLDAFNQGRLQSAGKRVVVVGGGDTSIDVATVARRLGWREDAPGGLLPEQQILGAPGPGGKAHVPAHSPELTAQGLSATPDRQLTEVTLTSIFTLEKMQASPREVEHALCEGIEIRGGFAPLKVLCDASGRATALQVIGCKAQFARGKLQIEHIAGSEEIIEADLIVSAVGQAIDLSTFPELDNGEGAIPIEKNFQVRGRPGMFAAGDALRAHLLATAIGQSAIAAEGIDRYLRGQETEKRPKIDVHAWSLERDLATLGRLGGLVREPIRGTDANSGAVHNFDDRSERYVISAKELFLGHFGFMPRNRRESVELNAEQALGNFEERTHALAENAVRAEAKRCMSCGLCFECDNCVVYCPQKAVFKTPKAKTSTGRYVDTDYDRCIGCHICKDVCPTGYIQMGLGE